MIGSITDWILSLGGWFALAIVFAALLQTSAAKTPAAPVVPMTLDKGDQSNVDDAKQAVVRTEAEWAKLWNQHSPDHQRPAVDFSRQMVIGTFMGSRPTAGFSIDIVSTIQANGVLTVQLAPDQILAALSLEFADELRAPQIEESVIDIENRIRAAHPEVVTLFVKPQTSARFKASVRERFAGSPLDSSSAEQP